MKIVTIFFLIVVLLTGCEESITKTEEHVPEAEMVLLEEGSFLMGNDKGNSNQCPEHTVTLGAFYISNLEITQKQFSNEMGYLPEGGYGEGDQYPVFGVSWEEALEYCNQRSESEGLTPCYDLADSTCNWAANGYRLPTEAEWEYAARGAGLDEGLSYSGSDEIERVAWFRNNAGNKTHLVGQKEPNSKGLYDMSGNVWEWCWDWYRDEYYNISPSENPLGPQNGEHRVTRGGSWYSGNDNCCCCYRSICQSYGSNYIGFRVVRTAE